MPDIKDAINVITDPANVHVDDSHSAERRVNGKRAVKALRGQGAKPAEARKLVTEAVLELGGRVGAEVQAGGRGASKSADTWHVPGDKVRKY